MKKLLKRLLISLAGMFYAYEWAKRLLCRYSVHKKITNYNIYEQCRIRKSYDKTEIVQKKVCYDPYLITSCAWCGKTLKVERLSRKLSQEQILKYSQKVADKIQIINKRAINNLKIKQQ